MNFLTQVGKSFDPLPPYAVIGCSVLGRAQRGQPDQREDYASMASIHCNDRQCREAPRIGRSLNACEYGELCLKRPKPVLLSCESFYYPVTPELGYDVLCLGHTVIVEYRLECVPGLVLTQCLCVVPIETELVVFLCYLVPHHVLS